MNLLSVYEVRARYVPSVITALPIIVFSGFVKQEVWVALFQNVSWFLVIENVSLSVIAVLFLIHVQRGIAKHLFEERFFSSGCDFPTTRLLLFSDEHLSRAFKLKIRDKIENDFGIELWPQAQEEKDEKGARHVIRDAVGLVRKAVGDGDKTLQYNIHYGFSRNIVGGSAIAVPSALCSSIYAGLKGQLPALSASAVMFIVFAVILFLSKSILTHYGRAYAECLFAEFIAEGKGG